MTVAETVDERREAAERLRGDLMHELGVTEGALAYAIGYTAASGMTYTEAVHDMLSRLADLVDPTCRMAYDRDASALMCGPRLTCSACGAHVPTGIGYRYCPRCGARIEEDER